MKTPFSMNRNSIRSIPVFAAIVLALGCGQPDQNETAPVTGTVTYAGEPLKKGTIIFEMAGARPANGKIVDGKIIDVMTYKPSDGAPVGTHNVAIQSVTIITGSAPAGSSPADANMGSTMRVESHIPKRYGNPATSALEAEVKADTENRFTFELEK